MKQTEEKTRKIYRELTELLIRENRTVSAMESCTGGLIASLLTDMEGASLVVRGGIVSYCNEAKIRFGVPKGLIGTYGVYSAETAKAMAETAQKQFLTDIGIGVTGTFRNADPANSDSVPGKVYVAMLGGFGIRETELTVPLELDRNSAKLFVARVAAEELLLSLREQ